MGALCCCPQADRAEDFSLPSSSPFYGNCICLRFLIGQLFNTYSSLFHRDHSTIASSRPSSSDPPGRNSDDSIAGTFRPPPRPLPYDDPRCSPLYRERSITVFSKGCSHCHEETEPLRCSVGDPNGDSTQVMAVGAAADEASKSGASQMQLKQWQSDVPYVFDSFEDEEVCPTCLEEYTVEDPKIILRCSHHFHLGCIYEWMERSEACPVCGKAMVFSERT